MDKKVVLAVAGSGKTSLIIDSLDSKRRALILSYTTVNRENIESKIIDKMGSIPENITVMTYFEFLYRFCYLPFFKREAKTRGIIFLNKIPRLKGINKSKFRYYQSKDGYIYANRLALLLQREKVYKRVIDRLERHFDSFIIDEIQDFSSHDFDFIKTLSKARMSILYVGDFFQKTYATSHDGVKGKGLFDSYDKYKKTIMDGTDLVIDEEKLQNSYRCSPSLCEFVTSSLKITIHPHRTGHTKIKDYTKDNQEALRVFHNDKIVKLFYQGSHLYNCNSLNWAKSKGSEYKDVCVVLNDTTLKHFNNKKLSELKPTTLKKLYVAITRTSGDLYFISEKHLKHLKMA